MWNDLSPPGIDAGGGRKIKERGPGRAPTLVAAYLVSTGMTVKEALWFIKRKRLSIHPNQRQRARLEKFSRFHKRR